MRGSEVGSAVTYAGKERIEIRQIMKIVEKMW